MGIRRHTLRVGLSSAVAIAALTLLATAAACGGTSSPTSPPATRGDSVPTSPTASPSVVAAAERFMGSDSVAVTREMVSGARATLNAPTPVRLAAGYNRDSVVDDLGINMRFQGKADATKAIRQNMREYSAAKWTAGYTGRGVTVIEERWESTKSRPPGAIQVIAVATVRDGKVVHEYDSYQVSDNLPNSKSLEPKPLTSAPGPADTPAMAEAVALKYAAALQAKDAAALAALSAPTIAFMDTAWSTTGASSADVQAHYARIFSAPADLAFNHVKYAFGAGWAAVIWTAGSQSYGESGGGATMLEIRDGKIARHTLYYNGSNVPFSL